VDVIGAISFAAVECDGTTEEKAMPTFVCNFRPSANGQACGRLDSRAYGQNASGGQCNSRTDACHLHGSLIVVKYMHIESTAGHHRIDQATRRPKGGEQIGRLPRSQCPV
jgi:hypothetical protein